MRNLECQNGCINDKGNKVRHHKNTPCTKKQAMGDRRSFQHTGAFHLRTMSEIVRDTPGGLNPEDFDAMKESFLNRRDEDGFNSLIELLEGTELTPTEAAKFMDMSFRGTALRLDPNDFVELDGARATVMDWMTVEIPKIASSGLTIDGKNAALRSVRDLVHTLGDYTKLQEFATQEGGMLVLQEFHKSNPLYIFNIEAEGYEISHLDTLKYHGYTPSAVVDLSKEEVVDLARLYEETHYHLDSTATLNMLDKVFKNDSTAMREQILDLEQEIVNSNPSSGDEGVVRARMKDVIESGHLFSDTELSDDWYHGAIETRDVLVCVESGLDAEIWKKARYQNFTEDEVSQNSIYSAYRELNRNKDHLQVHALAALTSDFHYMSSNDEGFPTKAEFDASNAALAVHVNQETIDSLDLPFV